MGVKSPSFYKDKMSSPIVGPIPPYSNPPIQPEFYKPHSFVISNVSLGRTTTVTTVLDMDYVIGQLVRLLIPPTFGCRQLNEQTGYVISIPADNQVVIDIDSSQNVDPYTSSSATTKPQIVPVGDINMGATNFGRLQNITYIPGSFINISPQ